MPAILRLYKNAYKGLSKETWFLALVILINRSGTMVLPFMTMYATEKLGLSIVQAGFIMASFGAGSIVGAFIGGKVTDAVGFHSVQLFALFGGGIMFITVGHLTAYSSLCTGTFILSVINESFRPANSSATAYYSLVENRTRSFSLNRLAVNFGWAFGGTIGGFLAAKNYNLLFWVDGVTNIFAGILLIFVLPVPKKTRQNIRDKKQESISQFTSAYRDKEYLFFIVLTVLFAFCFFQMFTILPVYLKTKLGVAEEEYGMLMAMNGLIIAIMEMVLVYKIERTKHSMHIIKYGVWLVGISFGIYNIINGNFLVAFFSILIITIGEMLSMPFMNTYWLNRSNDYNRGQYAALYTMAWGTAQIASPSIGGWVAQTYSFSMLWWMVFIITIFAGFGYSWLVKRTAELRLS